MRLKGTPMRNKEEDKEPKEKEVKENKHLEPKKPKENNKELEVPKRRVKNEDREKVTISTRGRRTFKASSSSKISKPPCYQKQPFINWYRTDRALGYATPVAQVPKTIK